MGTSTSNNFSIPGRWVASLLVFSFVLTNGIGIQVLAQGKTLGGRMRSGEVTVENGGVTPVGDLGQSQPNVEMLRGGKIAPDLEEALTSVSNGMQRDEAQTFIIELRSNPTATGNGESGRVAAEQSANALNPVIQSEAIAGRPVEQETASTPTARDGILITGKPGTIKVGPTTATTDTNTNTDTDTVDQNEEIAGRPVVQETAPTQSARDGILITGKPGTIKVGPTTTTTITNT
ncbi:MAG: hypothetical protein HOP17_07800, partial [Acidobacteria bacterium]|nr:hypothetical protein [Acidobacteriota bacterium]